MTPSEFETIWKDLHPKVYGYFYRRVDNMQDADDLTCESLTAFFRAHQNQEIEHTYGYLWKICRFKLIDYYNDSKRQNILPLTTEGSASDVYEAYRSKQYQHSIKALMQCLKKALNDDQFTIFYAIYIEEKQTKDIAQAMKIPAARLRKRMSRLLQKVRQSCRSIWKDYQSI